MKWCQGLVQIFCLLIFLPDVLAGTIAIQGMPELSFTLSQQTITVEGHIEFTNLGDETAMDVFPELQVGSWKWTGKAHNLDPNETHRWPIFSTAHITDWNCREDHCKALDLPPFGTYPLIIRRYYQDLNGYPFSILNMNVIKLGIESSDLQSPLNSPITGHLNVQSHGQSFTARLLLENLSEDTIEVVPTLISSKEISVPIDQAHHKSLRISPKEKINLTFEGENRQGLLQSSHNVFAIINWQSSLNGADLRHTRAFLSQYQVLKSTKRSYYWVLAIIGAFLLGITIIYLPKSINKGNLEKTSKKKNKEKKK